MFCCMLPGDFGQGGSGIGQAVAAIPSATAAACLLQNGFVKTAQNAHYIVAVSAANAALNEGHLGVDVAVEMLPVVAIAPSW